MNKKAVIMFLITGLVLMLITPAALARGHWHSGFLNSLPLELTEAQQEQLAEAREAYWQETEALREELSAQRELFASLKRDWDTAGSEIKIALDDLSEIRLKLIDHQLKHRQQLETILTEEQLEELKELEKHTAHHHGKRNTSSRRSGRR